MKNAVGLVIAYFEHGVNFILTNSIKTLELDASFYEPDARTSTTF